MSLLKSRLAATDEKLEAMRAERRAAARSRRKAGRESRADRERKLRLVGEAVMQRVERGEWDEAEFLKMMEEALSRPNDRALFGIKTPYTF